MFRRACMSTRKCIRAFSDAPSEVITDSIKPALSGFAKAYDKQTAQVTEHPPAQDNRSFASLLRQSKFVDVSNITQIIRI